MIQSSAPSSDAKAWKSLRSAWLTVCALIVAGIMVGMFGSCSGGSWCLVGRLGCCRGTYGLAADVDMRTGWRLDVRYVKICLGIL